MLLACCICACSILDHDFYKKVKVGRGHNCCQFHYHLLAHLGLVKYRTVWASVSRYFLLDAFSLAGLGVRFGSVVDLSACMHAASGAMAAPCMGNYKSPQQYDCRENRIYVYRITRFLRKSTIDLWIPLVLLSECSALN